MGNVTPLSNINNTFRPALRPMVPFGLNAYKVCDHDNVKKLPLSSLFNTETSKPTEHYVFAPGFCGGTTSDLEAASCAGGLPCKAIMSMPNTYPSPETLVDDMSLALASEHPHTAKPKPTVPLENTTTNRSIFSKLWDMGQKAVSKLLSIQFSLLQYFRFHNSQSKAAQQYAEKMHRDFLRKGFSPEKPAEVTMVAHSGGIAPSIAMARQPSGKFAFNVKEIVSYGSPVTPALLKKLPADVKLRYVVSKGDTLHNGINLASKAFYTISGLELVSWDVAKHHPNTRVIYTSKPVGHKAFAELPAHEIENHIEPGT